MNISQSGKGTPGKLCEAEQELEGKARVTEPTGNIKTITYRDLTRCYLPEDG